MAITYHSGRRIQGLSTEGASTVTFEDDFSTDKGWTTTDSGKYSYNSGGWIAFDALSDQSDNRISIDIGTTLSNTAWVMRWKQEVTGFAQGTQAQHLSLDIGISDREVNGSTAIGIIKAHHASNSSVNYTNVSGYAVSAGTDYDSYGGTPSYPNGNVSGFTPSAKTNWVELKRTGSTTASLAFYTDDSYSASALDGSVREVTIGSSPTGLRYVMLGSEFSGQVAGSARYSGKFSELKIYDGVTSVVTETQRPTNVQVGSRWEETDTRKMYYKFDATTYHSADWYELGTAPYAGGRGVFGGGYASTYQNVMEYITIATPSNATDFGDLTVARIYLEAVSSLTRGVFGGGHTGANSDVMDYITFGTPSNATDFGNLTVARHAIAGVSSGTRGVFGGGNGSNVMDYITIATPSNATDFGDLTVTRQDLAGVSSDTRGVFGGGDGSNVMDYITIATTGNATDFGDLTMNRRYPADVSNGTRGVFAGGDPTSGQSYTNSMDYITIATTGNATDFGDLVAGRQAPAGVESDTRGVIGGGGTGGSSYSNVIQYITIATTGNATDFGDLTVATSHLGGASRF